MTDPHTVDGLVMWKKLEYNGGYAMLCLSDNEC